MVLGPLKKYIIIFIFIFELFFIFLKKLKKMMFGALDL